MVEGIIIREGQTDLIVPAQHSSGGPGKIYDDVFFNEQMAFNRDVSVMLLRALGGEMKVADCMAATGSRSVRIAKEVPGTDVVANDINPAAIAYMEENIRMNGVSNCRPNRENLQVLLGKETFDYVDLDPFGSPIPFLHAAIQGCRRGAVLAVTATDTAPLAGAHSGKCVRRYSATPLRGYSCHESGLRILMGAVARELAKFDMGMEPILSFYADHYFRTYVRVRKGAGAADKTLAQLIHVALDPNTLQRSVSLAHDAEHRYGPMWGGKLFDKEIISRMDATGMADEKRCRKMLELWSQELDEVPFMYDVSEFSSHLKISSPRYDTLLELLNKEGLSTRTHISPTGFKSVLSVDDIKRIFIQASETR